MPIWDFPNFLFAHDLICSCQTAVIEWLIHWAIHWIDCKNETFMANCWIITLFWQTLADFNMQQTRGNVAVCHTKPPDGF